MEVFGDASEFPYAATTYRLTEHFHFWTKHAQINAVLQPELFVEISEQLAAEKGIAGGSWVRVSSNRGFIRAKAVVTKRIKPLTCDGKTVHVVGIPLHWGFTGAARKGFGTNTLTPLRRRRQHRDARVQGVPGRHRAGVGAGGLREGRGWPISSPSTSAAGRRAPISRPACARRSRSRSSSTSASASAARPARRPASSGTTCARRSATTPAATTTRTT